MVMMAGFSTHWTVVFERWESRLASWANIVFRGVEAYYTLIDICSAVNLFEK